MSPTDKHSQFPIGHLVNMRQQGTDPYPVFDQLLVREPVSWIDEVGLWYVTRRADVLKVLADTATFTVVSENSLMREALGHNMLTTDGTEQGRLRRPFAHPFAPRQVTPTAAPWIEGTVHRLIDGFIDQGAADIKRDLADVLAIEMVMDVLGFPVDDPDRVRRWVDNFNRIMSNYHRDPAVIAQGAAVNAELVADIGSLLAALRADPNGSVMGELVAQTDSGLTTTELIDAARVIIFGGVETTSALITNALWALLRHPDQFEQVRANPSLIPNAIEEALRWESPVQTCTRHLTRDTRLAGVQLREGDTLQCMLGAANRDPAHYDNPAVFDIHRPNAKDHLAFANGKHYCIGAGLARLEATTALRILFERLPDLRLLDPDADRPHGYEFRACPQLRLAW